MSSIFEDSWLGHKIQRDPKNVTTDIHKAFIYSKSLGDDKCLLKMVVNADPHLDYIPQRILNWGLKNVIGVWLHLIQKRAKNLPEKNLQMMQEKKEFYDELMRKINEVDEGQA